MSYKLRHVAAEQFRYQMEHLRMANQDRVTTYVVMVRKTGGWTPPGTRVCLNVDRGIKFFPTLESAETYAQECKDGMSPYSIASYHYWVEEYDASVHIPHVR